MKVAALLVAFCATLSLMPANAGIEDAGAGRTVQDLYRDCKSNGSVAEVVCQRYLEGVIYTLWVGEALMSNANMPAQGRRALRLMAACNSRSVNGLQVKQVFIKWVEAHPQEARSSEIIGAWEAIRGAWPCVASPR